MGAPRYDLVTLDLDGTLIDSIGDIAAALNRMLASRGVEPLGEREVVKLVGGGAPELVRRALDLTRHPEREAWLPTAVVDYQRMYTESPLSRTSLYLGVRETLDRLDGVALAVATNKPGALARQILDGLGLGRHFVTVLGADDVGQKKPSPLMIDLARGTVGTTRERTLHVGDSLVDADTADAARVDLALVTYGYEDPERLTRRHARAHLDRFSSLLELVFDGP
jgi:phosphoglycolate phosphatase